MVSRTSDGDNGERSELARHTTQACTSVEVLPDCRHHTGHKIKTIHCVHYGISKGGGGGTNANAKRNKKKCNHDNIKTIEAIIR